MTTSRRLRDIEARTPVAGSPEECPACIEWAETRDLEEILSGKWRPPPACHPPRHLTAEETLAVAESICDLVGEPRELVSHLRPDTKEMP